MSKILIGYEYGLGMGHLARLLPIARTLADRGHQIVFFLRNPHECTKILAKEKLPILPVMNIWANIPEMRRQPRYNSYSDFMAMASGNDTESLFTVTMDFHSNPGLLIMSVNLRQTPAFYRAKMRS